MYCTYMNGIPVDPQLSRDDIFEMMRPKILRPLEDVHEWTILLERLYKRVENMLEVCVCILW